MKELDTLIQMRDELNERLAAVTYAIAQIQNAKYGTVYRAEPPQTPQEFPFVYEDTQTQATPPKPGGILMCGDEP